MLIVETEVAAGDWPALDWATVADAAARAAVAATPYAHLTDAGTPAEIAVRLSDDADVQALNRQYRHKDKPTNVLSFPMVQADLLDGLANGDADDSEAEILLGDIVLAWETVAREAAEKSIPAEDHARHLIVHGVLHLLGYDHEQGDAEAAAMEDIERAACARLGIADPYAADADADADGG